jgi:hypothetical protein
MIIEVEATSNPTEHFSFVQYSTVQYRNINFVSSKCVINQYQYQHQQMRTALASSSPPERLVQVELQSIFYPSERSDILNST